LGLSDSRTGHGPQTVGGLSKVKSFAKENKITTLKFTATRSFRLKSVSQTTKILEDSGSVSPDTGFTVQNFPA